MNINPNDEVLKSFVGKVAGRVGQEAIWNQELGCYQLVSKNWSSFAVKMYHYFFITHDGEAGVKDFESYVEKCVDWSLKNYDGVIRGMQKGVAVHPVLISLNPSPEIIAYTKQKPKAHFAAFVMPTVCNLSSGTIEYLEKTPVLGFAMWKEVRTVTQKLLGYEELRTGKNAREEFQS